MAEGKHSMKEQRQNAILEIVRAFSMETQEQLLEELRKRGFRCTQATVSRDIRELHLVKEQTPLGTYCYALPLSQTHRNPADRLQTIFREGVVSFDYAQNLVVLKTMPGLAAAAAAAIDKMEIPQMVGSIAGDDTVMLIMRTTQSAESFCDELRSMVK